MRRTQVNVRMTEEDATALKVDAIKVGARLDHYLSEAASYFRKSLTIEERRNRFAGARKGAGRPVGA